MPTTIPAKTEGSLGEVLANTRTPVENELSAVHVERIKSLLIELSTEIGATGAPDAASILGRLAALDLNVAQNNLAGEDVPGPTNDETEGYEPGSIWVVPGMGALVCVDATEGAALWGLITEDPDYTPVGDGILAVGRAINEGTDTAAARVDHVHDGGVIAVSVESGDFTLEPADEVVLTDATSGNLLISISASCVTAGPRSWLVKKTDGNTNTISVQPPSGHAVEGGAVDAIFVLPDSDATDLPAWTLIYQGGTTWWVA